MTGMVFIYKNWAFGRKMAFILLWQYIVVVTLVIIFGILVWVLEIKRRRLYDDINRNKQLFKDELDRQHEPASEKKKSLYELPPNARDRLAPNKVALLDDFDELIQAYTDSNRRFSIRNQRISDANR